MKIIIIPRYSHNVSVSHIVIKTKQEWNYTHSHIWKHLLQYLLLHILSTYDQSYRVKQKSLGSQMKQKALRTAWSAWKVALGRGFSYRSGEVYPKQMTFFFGTARLEQPEFNFHPIEEHYPKQMMRFVFGMAGFLLSCLPLFDFETIRPPLWPSPLHKCKLKEI
jgi:hypothetical protein